MVKNSDLPKTIGVWTRRKEGSNVYFYRDSYAASLHEDTQTMTAGAYKPVGALIAKQEVETVEDVRHFLNYVAKRFLKAGENHDNL